MEASSETSSFRRREVELGVVEERFRESHLRTEPLIPVESKFKEIFDHDEDPNSTNMNSLLFRLHLDIARRDKPATVENLDGNGSGSIIAEQKSSRKTGPRLHRTSSLQPSDHGYLKVPVADYGTSRAKSTGTSLHSSRKSGESERPRGFSSSKEGEETAQLWKSALRAGTKSSRSPGSSISSNTPEAPYISRTARVSGLNKVPITPQPSGNESLGSSLPGVHSPTCERRPSHDDELTFRMTLMESNTILQAWAQQLKYQDDEAREMNRGHASVCSPVSQAIKMPPASWARFPSHSREERNAAAGEDDNVKSKDFAVKGFSTAGKLNWITDTPHDGPPPICTGRSFSDKFVHTLKTRWGKLISRHSGTPSRDRSMQGGRRSSIQTGGDLEYPELELLPTAGRHRDLRALERGIDEMKGVTTQRRSSSDNIALQRERPSLTEKMASALQQHDGGSDADLSKTDDATSYVEEKASMVRFQPLDTPATEIRYPDTAHAKEVSGSTVERYATPLSRLTPSEHGPSRAVTPDFGVSLPPTTHSLSSSKTLASVVRRGSLNSTPDLNLSIDLSIDQPGICHGGDKSKRRSAPLPVTPGLV